MAEQVFPTKGNLIKTKRQLAQAIMGFELMDRKRNILVHEMVSMVDDARAIRNDIQVTYSEAYKALETANVTLGLVENLASMFPIDNTLSMSSHSVMGVELPTIASQIVANKRPVYAMEHTNSAFDRAYVCFKKVKVLTVSLAQTENSIYRLANSIKKTQKRANALKYIIIPRLREQVKFITDALDEKEREEFSRQKVIKKRKL